MRLLVSVLLHALSCSLVARAGDADVRKREAVKQAFLTNYRAYERYAFGFDELKPIAKQGENTNEGAGLGGTIVDAMSSMLVMGLGDSQEYQRALRYVQQKDFTATQAGSTPGAVSLYELTIRYIGGMLSAYQLGGEKPAHKALIQKAKSMADTLMPIAWQTPSQKIPYNSLNLITRKPDTGRDTNIAQAGSLILEWGTLSRYTNTDTYVKKTSAAMDAMRDLPQHWPGLFPTGIKPGDGSVSTKYITWGGGSDSFYEYLLKYPVLLGQADHPFLQTYKQTIDSTIAHLASKTGVGNLTFMSDFNYDKDQRVNVFSELACFSGGIVAYSGKLLDRTDWVQFGLELAESCGQTYSQTELGLGPYAFGWFDADGAATGYDYVSTPRRSFYNEHGFFVTFAYWLQQAEVMASLFYAYRITGQQYWRNVAWRAFENMQKYADTGTAWAAVDNVNDESAGLYDSTGPWLFSETFTYLYLMFDDADTFSLDDYVFTTQGHPLKRARTGSFGKVQGTSDYKPIYTGKGSNDDAAVASANKLGEEKLAVTGTGEAGQGGAAKKVAVTTKQRPQHVFDVKKIGEGKEKATKSFVSHCPTVPHPAAAAMFSPLPKIPQGN